jgi:hypothetical protein
MRSRTQSVHILQLPWRKGNLPLPHHPARIRPAIFEVSLRQRADDYFWAAPDHALTIRKLLEVDLSLPINLVAIIDRRNYNSPNYAFSAVGSIPCRQVGPDCLAFAPAAARLRRINEQHSQTNITLSP